MRVAIFIAICFIASIDARTVAKTCILNINTDLGVPQPLYLHHNTAELLTLEDASNQIHLNSNEKIDLYCTSGFRPPFSDQTKMITATCVSGKRFSIDNKTVNFVNATCVKNLDFTTRLSNRKCAADKTVEVGVSVKDKWISLYEVCHDNETASTLWVHHQLTPKTQLYQRSVERINFLKGNFYKGINPSTLYSKAVQRKTVARILGSKNIAEEIISDSSDLFLARGHLAAKTDFIFGAHQLISFHYINAAPQWQTFNGGNWLTVENGVKKFIEKRNIDADLYTGTHGIFTYPDSNKKQQEIFLSWNEKTEKHQIPVPKFYYKVLIAEEIQAGIVFIGVNHPYLKMEEIKSDYILCPDVSGKVDYVNWDRENITAGYSYACSVPDFIKVVTVLPELPKVTKLLV